MKERSPNEPAPGSLHLVAQDIHLRRAPSASGSHVIAEVECTRRRCTMDVEQCAGCPHFVRIETHEAGYLLLCQGANEPPAHDDALEDRVPTADDAAYIPVRK